MELGLNPRSDHFQSTTGSVSERSKAPQWTAETSQFLWRSLRHHSGDPVGTGFLTGRKDALPFLSFHSFIYEAPGRSRRCREAGPTQSFLWPALPVLSSLLNWPPPLLQAPSLSPFRPNPYLQPLLFFAGQVRA